MMMATHAPQQAPIQNHNESDDENAQLPFKLTVSEYEEIAQRHESSLKQLELIKSALDTPENLKNLRGRVEQDCE